MSKHVRSICEKQLLGYCIEILTNGSFTPEFRKKGCFRRSTYLLAYFFELLAPKNTEKDNKIMEVTCK